MPTKEYMEMISRKLDAFKKLNAQNGSNSVESYKLPTLEEQMGKTALHYLNGKKKAETCVNTLFRDHNTT